MKEYGGITNADSKLYDNEMHDAEALFCELIATVVCSNINKSINHIITN